MTAQPQSPNHTINHDLPPELALLLARFEEWLTTAGYAPRTRVSYRRVVWCFLVWLTDQTPVRRITDLTPRHVSQYQTALCTQPNSRAATNPATAYLSVDTQALWLVIVRRFCTWLTHTQQLAFNPASGLQLPRRRRGLPRTILTRAEAKRLLAATPTRTPRDVRDKALVDVLYSTAIRRDELLNLTLSDLDLTMRTLTVRRGKGGDSRTLPLLDDTTTLLTRYLQHARPVLAALQDGHRPTNRLFISSRSGGPLDKDDVGRILNKAVRLARLHKHVTPHTVRHSAATHLLQGQADIRQIQQFLGHRCLSSTEVYTRVEVSDLRAVLRRCHPREKAR